jgi:hypothetical protein
VASAAAFNGFNQTVEIIKKTTAAQIGKRQVEEIARTSARDFDEFYQARFFGRYYAKKPINQKLQDGWNISKTLRLGVRSDDHELSNR